MFADEEVDPSVAIPGSPFSASSASSASDDEDEDEAALEIKNPFARTGDEEFEYEEYEGFKGEGSPLAKLQSDLALELLTPTASGPVSSYFNVSNSEDESLLEITNPFARHGDDEFEFDHYRSWESGVSPLAKLSSDVAHIFSNTPLATSSSYYQSVLDTQLTSSVSAPSSPTLVPTEDRVGQEIKIETMASTPCIYLRQRKNSPYHKGRRGYQYI